LQDVNNTGPETLQFVTVFFISHVKKPS